jgi:glucose/arabinose dehydrogenase
MHASISRIKFASFVVSLLLLVSCGVSSNGGGQAPSPPPPPPPPPPLSSVFLSQVLPGVSLTNPVALLQAPGSALRWYAVEQQGIVKTFSGIVGTTDNDVDIFIDISGRVSSGGPLSETGLLGMAFHPDYSNNGEVFLSYTRGGPVSYVSRFRSMDDGVTLDDASEEIIMTIVQDFGNHNGGQIEFGPEGYLYAGWGDGGNGGDPNDRGQDTSNLLGTFTRIDVDSAAPYAVPPTNPFAGNAYCVQGFGAAPCPEIYAWGVRNPWRWSFDRQTGEIWAGFVGKNAYEEIDRIVISGNYGWDEREGAHCFEPATGCSTNFIDPVTEYGRSLGVSVTGGYVYRGNINASLQGMYVYGDFGTGRIWAVPANSPQGSVGNEIIDTPYSISAFAEDFFGELYVLDYGTGNIYVMFPTP